MFVTCIARYVCAVVFLCFHERWPVANVIERFESNKISPRNSIVRYRLKGLVIVGIEREEAAHLIFKGLVLGILQMPVRRRRRITRGRYWRATWRSARRDDFLIIEFRLSSSAPGDGCVNENTPPRPQIQMSTLRHPHWFRMKL